MNILITGGLGHIGSKLLRLLKNKRKIQKIYVLDNLSTQRYCSLFNISKKKIIFINQNVVSNVTYKLISKSDVVIHLSAQTDATASLDNPKKIFSNNLNSTKYVVQSVKKLNKKLIFISSTSVYGPQSNRVFEDKNGLILRPQSPYAECKIKEEKYILNTLYSANKENFIILRFGTIYGSSQGMRFHTAVNKFCWQAVFNEPITVWKNALRQHRPYLGINDACESIYHIIKKDLFSNSIYNVLSQNKTVEDILKIIKKKIKNIDVVFIKSKILNQQGYFVDMSKFKKTGFVAKDSIKKLIFEEIRLLS